jgi:hypothetical protein
MVNEAKMSVLSYLFCKIIIKVENTYLYFYGSYTFAIDIYLNWDPPKMYFFWLKKIPNEE